MAWYHEIGRDQWRVLAAAQLGWILDAMDVLFYSFALTAVRSEFRLTSAEAGALAAVPMLTSAAGGVLFGYLSDRFGRARMLGWTIVTFSALTALTATSRSVMELVLWRAASGIGLGGEWAVGSVLIAETWPERHRGKGIGLMQSGWALGYMVAALLAALILPRWGWRALFLAGAAPALFTWFIRRGIAEPAAWRKSAQAGLAPRELLRPPLRRRLALLTALCCCLLFGYWGLFTWLPAYLSSPLAAGGAGLSIVRSSAWIVPMQAGAFLGYVSFGFFADRYGRRRVFVAFVLATAALVPVYALGGRSAALLLALGPLLGYFGHGYFSALGVIAAELFPPAVRATAQGLSYNVGRALSALAPATVGALADRHGLGASLALTSIFFVLGAAAMGWMTAGDPAVRSQAGRP
jgi:MFS family permease